MVIDITDKGPCQGCVFAQPREVRYHWRTSPCRQGNWGCRLVSERPALSGPILKIGNGPCLRTSRMSVIALPPSRFRILDSAYRGSRVNTPRPVAPDDSRQLKIHHADPLLLLGILRTFLAYCTLWG